MNPYKPPGLLLASLALGLSLTVCPPAARANVYATNIKLNGGMTNVSAVQGSPIAISYILNEPASAGVTIQILSGTTALRTISLTNGSPGTLRGLNTNVVWNGTDDHGQPVGPGNYSVSITAASSGYPGWTKISDDDNPGNYAWEARGIAVDRNPRSPYYGRVFVGNSFDNSQSGTLPGDFVGIQKLNADGSYADEGAFSDGGMAWSGNYSGPWKIRVSDDDQVYIADFANSGDVYRFDGTISSNSMQHVFAPATDGSQGSWSGFCVTGQGTNTVLWGADNRGVGSSGIKKFAVQLDGTFDPASGTQVVAVAGSPGLSIGPYALAVSGAGAIYTLQDVENQGNPDAKVFGFPAYDPATNNGLAETTALWTAGPGDDYSGARGIAVDPTGTYVAASFWGYFSGFVNVSGNIKILNATNGTVITNLDLGIAFTNHLTTDPTHHLDTDCDWDAVGNLYYLDDWPPCWRVFSPPGTNQATTVAVPMVQITGLPTPVITAVVVTNGTVTVFFTAGAGESPAAFALFGSSGVTGPYTLMPTAVITGSGGSFKATAATNGTMQYYQIERSTAVPQGPVIQNLRISGAVATINFTGASTDSASAFTLVCSDTMNGTYTAATNATVTGSAGSYQVTVPVSGPRQFYRIRR